MEPSRWSPYEQPQFTHLSGGSPHLPPTAPEDVINFSGTNSNPLLMSSCQGLPVSRTNADSASAGLSNSNYDSLIPQPIQPSKEAEFYDETLYNGVCKENQSGMHNFLQAQGSASRTESFSTESTSGYTGQVSSQPFHSSNLELPVSGSFGVLPHMSVKNNSARFERNNNEKYISKQPPVSYSNGPYTDRDVSGAYTSAPLSAQSAFSGDTASLSPVVNSVTSPSLSNFSSPSEFYPSPKPNFGAYNSGQSPVPQSPSVATHQSYPSSPYANVDPVGHISTAPPCSPMSGGSYVNSMNVVPQRNGQKSQHSPSNSAANNAICYNAPQSQNMGYHGPQSVLQKTPDYSEYSFTHDHNSPSSFSSAYPMHASQMSGGNNSRISPRTHTSHSNSIEGRISYGHSNTMTSAPISSPTYLQNKVSHEASYGACSSNISPGQSMHPPRYPPSMNHVRNNMHPNPSMMSDHLGNDRHLYSSEVDDGKDPLRRFNAHVDSGHSNEVMAPTYVANSDYGGFNDVTGSHLRSSESDDMGQNVLENSFRTAVSRPQHAKEAHKEIRSHGAVNYSYNSSHLNMIRPGNFSLNGPRRRGRRGRRRKVGVGGNATRYSFKSDCNIYNNGYPIQPPRMLDYANVDCCSTSDKRLCDEKELPPVNYSLSRYRSELKMTENQKKNCSVILSKPSRNCVSIEEELSFLGSLTFPEESEKDSPQTFMLTRNKDTEGFLQCYKNFLASRKSSSGSDGESLQNNIKSKAVTSISKELRNKIDNEQRKDKLVITVGRGNNNEWCLKSSLLTFEDESASASSSHYIKRENDAEAKSKRLKYTSKLNKVSEKYSKHSANRKRAHNDVIYEFSDSNSETLPTGEIRVKPEVESSSQYDIQSYSHKKRGRKAKNLSVTKTDSKKKMRRSSFRADSFVPIKIKQEVIEDDEIAFEGARRSLRTRRSDTSSSQELVPGPSIKQEKTDDKDHIDISSDEIDLLDDSDSDPAWTPSVKTPKSGDVKPHMHLNPRKRGPKARRRNSSGSGGVQRQKKEKSDNPRKRNTSASHSSSVKKQAQTLIDPTVKIKKEQEQFLIAKADIEQRSPFIWRVDKETNMLQRFESCEQQGLSMYRSTYTYAAWNENSFSNYVAAKVRVISHSRIMFVVEYFGPDVSETEDAETAENPLPEAEVPSTNPLRENFEVFLQTLISQALDPNFLTEITNENDEYFLNNIKEIENVTESKKKIITKDFWNNDLCKSVNMYPSFDVNAIATEGEECQVCEKENATKVLQFHGQHYDSITLGPVEQLSPHKSEYNVCNTCCVVLSLYSQLQHQKYNFFIKCRTKMNEVKNNTDKLESHVLLEECLQDHKWVDALFEELELMWKECDEKS